MTDYYDTHADSFVLQTVNVDMTPLYARFLAHLPEKARILDAGCGSGRDAKAFLNVGHDVVAMDASIEMARRAAVLIGQPVLHIRFEDIEFSDEFDGIWASASLLHVPRTSMVSVLQRLCKALKAGGTLYMSFKLGTEERIKDGRLFNDQDENSLATAISQVSGLEILDLWRTVDRRPGRDHEHWLNCIARQAFE